MARYPIADAMGHIQLPQPNELRFVALEFSRFRGRLAARDPIVLIVGTPDTNRTCDLSLRRGLLYPLSYRGPHRF